MRVLVTGASGHIGSALLPELLSAGHEIVGLARSDAAAKAIAALGAEVRRGDLDDLDGLRKAAADADGVIHLAYNHEAMRAGDGAGAAAADLRAVEAIGDALAGSDKAFVSVGGTLMLAFAGITGRPGTELDLLPGGPRIDSENATIALADRRVRSSVVRLSPLVHGPLDHHGFTPALIAIARATGVAGYLGDGANRWPAVQTADAARLCRLALENAPAGSRLHAVADEGVAFREIAEAIGRKLGVPVQAVAAADAGEHFTYLAQIVGLDNPTSNAHTRDLLGWQPILPGLIEDLNQDHYFGGAAAS